mmetsp:Transcript_32179/g.90500  ORF Transcript_32179/g.90500 Transcript_32179/m.90500 type:complete len:110 (+) Transcript_32179:372-701(+)
MVGAAAAAAAAATGGNAQRRTKDGEAHPPVGAVEGAEGADEHLWVVELDPAWVWWLWEMYGMIAIVLGVRAKASAALAPRPPPASGAASSERAAAEMGALFPGNLGEAR